MSPTPSFDQAAHDRFSDEGGPCMADPRPDCIETPAQMPRLAPRRMPQLRLACPSEGGAKRYRLPLWRSFQELDR
jgi:hypothetical protein